MSPGLIARKNGFPWFRPVHPGRRLTVRMDTTNYCNLRCSMCPMRLSDSDPRREWHHMDMEVFDVICREVFPIARTVGISCGAEPLTNPDFPLHLEKLYRSGVPYREMVTNGTLLTETMIDSLLEYPPTTISISVDGAKPETHAAIRDSADLTRIVTMIRALVRKRGRRRFPMIAFSTTLQRDNIEEAAAIVELAAGSGAESAGFVPLVPYEGLNTLDRVVDPMSEKAAWFLDKARSKAAELGISFHLSRSATGRGSAHPCPYLRDTVYIDPDGNIFPCPYWNTADPAGNIRSGFMETWHGEVYRRLREGRFIERDNCRACPEVTAGEKTVLKERQ